VIGEKVLTTRSGRLVPQTLEHVDLLTRWNNDREVLHWLHRSEDPPELLARPAMEAMVRRGLADRSEARFMIEAGDGALIGEIRLIGIHPCGRAELAILIGEKAYWSRGQGGAAITALLGFAFNDLGLRRVTLIADADNARGIACYERCGFRHEGVLRAHRLRYGKALDMVAMGVLREEFADGGRR